jgi:hypothetical protein
LLGAATSALTAAITSRVREYARGSSGRGGSRKRDADRDHDGGWR